MTPLLLPGEPSPEDRQLRHARWALALVVAVGLTCGAVELPEAAAVLLVAAVALAWATR